jgi:hypothetical protein
MARRKREKGIRVEIRLLPDQKALFESLLVDDESLSRWLRVAGIERARRLQQSGGREDGAAPQSPSQPSTKKKPRRKR